MSEKFPFTSYITKEQLQDLMSSALEGMAYWADYVLLENEKDSKKVNYMSEAIPNNIALMVHDIESGNMYKLTRKQVLNALGKVENHSFDSYDIYDAELVIQIALFGKKVYA